MKGQCRIDGFDYWVSAWTKQSEGGKFLSLAFQRKDKERVQEKIEKETGQPAANNDVPWES